MLTEYENRSVPIRKIWPEGAWPCFSPDGLEVVFTGLLDQPNSRLLMLRVDGGGQPRMVTPPQVSAKRPTWLSNGKQLVFNRDQSKIWTVDLETGWLEAFLPAASADGLSFFHPWAYPDERAVVVVSFSDTANGREGVLYKLTPNGADPVKQLTTFPEVCAGRPGVSPDGETVVFAGNAGQFAQGANQLWVVTPNGKPRRLEQAEPSRAQGRGPRWSPDGKWIACTSTRPAANPTEKTPRAVWIIRAGGQQAYRVTDHAFNPLHVAWSPDQRRLACGGMGCGLGLLELPERFHSSSPALSENELRTGEHV